MFYVVNGTTKIDRFEAAHAASVQIRDGAGPVGHVQLYDADGNLVREVVYGHAERAQRDWETFTTPKGPDE